MADFVLEDLPHVAVDSILSKLDRQYGYLEESTLKLITFFIKGKPSKIRLLSLPPRKSCINQTQIPFLSGSHLLQPATCVLHGKVSFMISPTGSSLNRLHQTVTQISRQVNRAVHLRRYTGNSWVLVLSYDLSFFTIALLLNPRLNQILSETTTPHMHNT